MSLRHLVIVLGDQLDPASAAFDGFDPGRDLIWMAELPEESTHVWSNKARITYFLSAMRHFGEALKARAIPLQYLRLGEHPHTGFDTALQAQIASDPPEKLVVVQPGDYRSLATLGKVAEQAGVPLEVRPDGHFLISLDDFRTWMAGRKAPRLEHFYRAMRKDTGLLMDGKDPVGGAWNFDRENRKPFGRAGPGMIPTPLGFAPDATTRAVIEDVQQHFADHPGSLAHFDWPVTPEQAEAALQDFVRHRLPAFGPFQDALWTGEPVLYHSRLAAAMNLKLISPLRVIEAAVDASERGDAPLASVEGFVRQILGWREYVRGLYWTRMPDYLDGNHLDAHEALPAFYWTGETDMHCLAETIRQTLDHGYAHHIQRLMVTGLFALLLGVEPRQVHAWYLAVYVDAVEWVELPNVLGMSQFADGGLMASKPYVASGKYIQRMSNYCADCPFDPADASGEMACPFTVLYWDFLMRHEQRFRNHPRAGMQWRNLDRLGDEQRAGIQSRAEAIRQKLQSG